MCRRPTDRPPGGRVGVLAVALALSVTLALAGCASLPAARMALPSELAAIEPVSVRGLGAGREGEWRVGEARGRFERSADRISWFDLAQTDRVGASFTVPGPAGAPASVRCRGRQATLTWRIVDAPVQPYGVSCRWDGGAELSLAAATHPTRDERVGRYRDGAVTLELRSVHRVQGSSLPLEAPIGYLMLEGGRPVAAVELNGTTPRLWRPAATSPLHRPATEAALALALLWDPAMR